KTELIIVLGLYSSNPNWQPKYKLHGMPNSTLSQFAHWWLCLSNVLIILPSVVVNLYLHQGFALLITEDLDTEGRNTLGNCFLDLFKVAKRHAHYSSFCMWVQTDTAILLNRIHTGEEKGNSVNQAEKHNTCMDLP
ncbi:hypothetical protein ACJX0J_014758, partial [Zea mays]